MNNPEAQKAIDSAESKLSDAIKSLKPQAKESEPTVEVMADAMPDVEVVIDVPKEKEPRRSEFVHTDDPKIKERIDDLYGQAKKSDARNQMLIDHNKLIEQKLEEYKQKLESFEQQTKASAVDKVESELKAQLRAAREENDYDAIDSIEDKLLDLRLEKRIASTQPEPKPAPKVDPQQQQFEAQYIRNAAYLEIIAQEKDANGKPLRGYLYNGHPDNDKALELFESIPKEFALPYSEA